MKVLLDTNAYTRLVKGHQPLAALLERTEALCLSTVVLGELYAGFKMGSQRSENLSRLEDFLENEVTELLGLTKDIAERYALLFAQLRASGTPIPTNDMWIAATALEAGARVVTYDAHFEKVPGLLVLAP